MDSHRILVVEPHTLNRVVMAQQLATLGHACTCVGDADAALARLAAEPFDLVLAACRMPGVDGFALASRVRDDAAHIGVAPVAVVGCSDNVAVDTTLAAQCGMRACIPTSPATHVLGEVLRRLLPVRGEDPIRLAHWPLFARASREDLHDARVALAQRDPVALRTAFHRIKGAAAMIGATAIADACKAGEAAVAAWQHDRLSAAIDEVHARLDAAQARFQASR
ncbi:response regulator [Lysobacter sp. KIS68-7]|uniref:response regulator n=1 Tax=Lysobacter sp. KIS68-7 TaxID=2904252 RepID=UPI001E31D838|nr:response regulator [Lysobacter sp. KIS68-7]UHQ20917.1 response regulator [Lysobacter sp. KIS68-7]